MRLLFESNSASSVAEFTTRGENYSALYANSTENYSGDEEEKQLNWAALAIIPIIFLVAMGNVLVIIAVFVDQKLRSATNCFLTSLALADLLVALTVMPPSLVMITNNYVWPFSDDLCGLWVMLDVFFSTSSILHLCMISLDRYLAFARPFHNRLPLKGDNKRLGRFQSFGSYDRSKMLKRVGIRILLVWTVALGIALPIPIIGKQDRSNLFVDEMCAINVAEFAIYGSLAAFFLPLVIMFVIYTLTIRALRQQARLVSSMLIHNGKNSPTSTNRRTSFRRHHNHKNNTSAEENIKPVYTATQFLQLRDSAVPDGDSGSSVTLLSRQLSKKQRKCQVCGIYEDTKLLEERSWARRVMLPFAKALRQIQSVTGLGNVMRNLNNNNMLETTSKKECTCQIVKTDYEREEGNRTEAKHRNSVRRLSSTLKNRAMASITNEQRASKVLGLIFVLFCVFWCPFFIVNVVSRLCSTCDQALMGDCMNWFVWVGYVSSGVNPCVYTLFSRRFRVTFHKLVRGRWSEVNRQKLKRNFSGRDNLTGSMNGRRSSRTSIKTAASSAKIIGADEVKMRRMSEEDIWLHNVKAAESFWKRGDLSRTERRPHTTQLVHAKKWRSSWATTTPNIKSDICQMSSETRCDPGCFEKQSHKRFKRTYSESDSNKDQYYVNEFKFAPMITQTAHASFNRLRKDDDVWLFKEEDFSGSDASSSSMGSAWSYGANHCEKSSYAGLSSDDAEKDNDAFYNETNFNILTKFKASTCCASSEADFVFNNSPSVTGEFSSLKVLSENMRCNSLDDVTLKPNIETKQTARSRQKSGMGGSFDSLSSNLLAS